jgi:hypothetical protein
MKLSTMDLKLSICAPNSKLPQHENAIKIMLNIKKKYVNCLLAYMATEIKCFSFEFKMELMIQAMKNYLSIFQTIFEECYVSCMLFIHMYII